MTFVKATFRRSMRMKRSASRRHAQLDPQGPPLVRQMTGGVMLTTWRDPDDTHPTAARTAKKISGYRSYCPLRKMLQRHGSASSITDSHILAADRLRAQADAVAIGFSGSRQVLPVQAIVYGPRTGPGAVAVRQARAWPAFRQAMKLFNAEQRKLLTWTVLLNKSVAAWCAERRAQGLAVTPSKEMHCLVGLLDRLAEHYGIEDDWEPCAD